MSFLLSEEWHKFELEVTKKISIILYFKKWIDLAHYHCIKPKSNPSFRWWWGLSMYCMFVGQIEVQIQPTNPYEYYSVTSKMNSLGQVYQVKWFSGQRAEYLGRA